MESHNGDVRPSLLAVAGAAAVACGTLAVLWTRPTGSDDAEPGQGAAPVPGREAPREADPRKAAAEALDQAPGEPRPPSPPVVGALRDPLPRAPTPEGDAVPAREGPAHNSPAAWRASLGGTLESAVGRLRGARSLSAMWDTERQIYWGWGTEGVLQALTLWQEGPREEGTPNAGALWLARSQAEFLLGRRREAAEHLVDAVLSMEREDLPVRKGEPGLLGFALRPNSSPLGAGETIGIPGHGEVGPDWGTSGAARRGGGSFLVWEGDGESYFAFVLETAADDSRPAEAMAATIWSHSVVFWVREFPHRQAPAAVRFLRTHDLAFPPEEATPDSWARVFENAWSFWLDRGDPSATRLRDSRERVRSFPDPGWKNRWRSDFFGGVLWSLDEEFRDRIPADDAPRAKELRILAARLLR